MPDHIHMIIELGINAENQNESRSNQKAAQGAAATSLSVVINALKGWVTRECGISIWQPNYYEHVIRSEAALEQIRNYILGNPFVEYDEIPWRTLDAE